MSMSNSVSNQTSTAAILRALRAAGAEFAVDGAELVVSGPKRVLIESVRQLIRERKDKLIALLVAEGFTTERLAIARALGIEEDKPGDYDHKASVAGGVPPLQVAIARHERMAAAPH